MAPAYRIHSEILCPSSTARPSYGWAEPAWTNRIEREGMHSSSATDSARQSLDKVSAGRAESVQLGAIESARVPAQARRDEPGQVKDQLGTETPGIGAC